MEVSSERKESSIVICNTNDYFPMNRVGLQKLSGHSLVQNGRNCVIEDGRGRKRKGYPAPDQTFDGEFNELLFVSIAL